MGGVEEAEGTRKERRLLGECRQGELKGSLEFWLYTTPVGSQEGEGLHIAG